MSSCERPSKRSDSDLVPSSVSKPYSFSTGTQGRSRRFFVSSSLRRVSSFSRWSSSSRAACHSSRVPILCSLIAFLLFRCGLRYTPQYATTRLGDQAYANDDERDRTGRNDQQLAQTVRYRSGRRAKATDYLAVAPALDDMRAF